MLDPHQEIQALVDNFVADLSELAKRLAIEQVKIAFGDGSDGVAPASAPVRASRPRRDQREIEALRGKLLAAIAEQPGCRAEGLNAALGTTTPEIAQPLRRLVAEQRVRTEGTRRGTRYFAVGPDLQHGLHTTVEPAAAADELPGLAG
jgi:hypothetical protein